MATVTETLEILRRDNPVCPQGELRMYAEAFVCHRAAAENVAINGPIVAHPRTGSPMENPYVGVLAVQMKIMGSLKKVRRTDGVWNLC